uniref:Uncharacterized protein n=1 Tax=Panagrolaimus sp. ES5 TaxID=591445 RepID=A0AC34F2W8_9BILA
MKITTAFTMFLAAIGKYEPQILENIGVSQSEAEQFASLNEKECCDKMCQRHNRCGDLNGLIVNSAAASFTKMRTCLFGGDIICNSTCFDIKTRECITKHVRDGF